MPSRPAGLEDSEGYMEMPGFEIRDPMWTVSLHDRPHLKAHKQLPRRRDISLPSAKLSPPRLRSQQRSIQRTALPNLHSQPITPPPKSSPAAPLTPPIGSLNNSENDVSSTPSVDTAIPIRKSPRSGLTTPIDQQKNLPTPDNTPPRDTVVLQRPSFITQPSLSSRAASFKTARENLSSDADTDRSVSPIDHDITKPLAQVSQRRNESHMLISENVAVPDHATPIRRTQNLEYLENHSKSTSEKLISKSTENTPRQLRHTSMPQPSVHKELGLPANISPLAREKRPASPQKSPKSSPKLLLGSPRKKLPHRNGSLRERLEQAGGLPTRLSTENFASDIGWKLPPESPKSFDEKVDSWRLSGISATSTIEAIVVDNPPLQRKPPLRHRGKNSSLRAASSPIPATNRSSWNSNVSSDSPHRLVHKTGRISNTDRWSQNSDASQNITVSSTNARSEPEMIPVVVIPQRKSSLKSSTSSSRRQSHTSTDDRPTTAPDHALRHVENLHGRKRTLSDSVASGTDSSRGHKDRHFPPAVPVRTSSLSAPTSRDNSRSSSMNSESVRQQRQAAEADVRQTLARMQSESPYVQPQNVFLSVPTQTDKRHESEIEETSGPTPPPIALTPFSQPSVLSASPGPVEISEATAVNLFAHNNHSLQLIEKGLQGESRVVPKLRLSTKEVGTVETEPSTPEQTNNPLILVDSPLRNPRDPPKPPAFKIIPPTPSGLTPADESDKQLGHRPATSEGKGAVGRRLESLKRAFSTRRYSESFIPSLTRGLNLKDARNRREEENFDDKLHPFWRPRGFWEDFSDSESGEEYPDEDIIVHNSLGIPQKRIIFDGPISLVRKISNPLHRNQDIRRRVGVVKRTSYGSLSRGGWLPGRRIYTIPGLNYRFQMLRLSEMQEKLRHAKMQREDERREKRREQLRKSIGPNVVAKSDSRFL